MSIEELVDFGELDSGTLRQWRLKSLRFESPDYAQDAVAKVLIDQVAGMEAHDAALAEEAKTLSPDTDERFGFGYEDHLFDLRCENSSNMAELLDLFCIRPQALGKRFDALAADFRPNEPNKHGYLANPSRFDVVRALGNYGRHRDEWSDIEADLKTAREWSPGSRSGQNTITIKLLLTVLPGLHAPHLEPDPAHGDPVAAREIHRAVLDKWYPGIALSAQMRALCDELQRLQNAMVDELTASLDS